MPSLTKDSRARSPFWICCYTSADGQRLKKSTKQTDRAKALEVCLSIERAERFAKAGTLTEQTAKKIIGEILERTTGEALHNFTAREWLFQWLEAKEQVRAGKTGERYRQVVRDFSDSLGNRAKLPLASVTPKDVLGYRNGLLEAGRMARTANLSVKVISSAFNAALRQGYIASNPCTAVETLPVESEEKGTFTPEQVSQLVGAAEGHWKGAILLAYFTGARLRDVANMQWSAVDLKRQTLTFKATKTNKPVTIPLHADLERHLLEAPGVGKAFLFPSLAGRATGGKHGLSGRFSAIVVRAGIEGKVSREGLRGTG